ncbi:hypothetical protein G1L02_00400 [Tenacibaculum finnmarkense]|uniref:hypothetical protein n=1 Tax=Tenacibaculum finnmarkense TaxID=2781243 RepID=UPI001EFB33E0|nr:hypothetical protein [Tenacibaculum finnmarkense]MCG8881636.1 hypothetical protein [Tenacibaculum finnmarkense]
MGKQKDRRRSFITNVKKNRISTNNFKANIKYSFDQEERSYILNKLPKKYSDIAYNNPLPKYEKDISKVEAYYSGESSLSVELSWYFDLLKKYSKLINEYLRIKDHIEIAILNNNIEKCFNLLDELDNKVCCSLFALQTELYINEVNNDSSANKTLLKSFQSESASSKLIVLLDFSRLRVDKNIASWQYDSLIEQHKKQYPDDLNHIIDYIDYKLNPVRYGGVLTKINFITFFDSDFSIIDRYNSLKNILSIVLFENDLESTEKKYIIERVHEFVNIFNDHYWEKLLLLVDENYNKISSSKDNINYYNIQDSYFNGNYNIVIEECNAIFKIQSNFSDLYLFYVKSLIISGKVVSDFIDNSTELYKVLQLIGDILLKNEDYISSRDKLLDKYYLINHFDFSTPLLEFLYNEFKLTRPKGIKYLTYLKGKAFRYNSYSLFKDMKKYKKLRIENNCHNLIINTLDGSQLTEKSNSFFELQLKISILLHQGKGKETIEELKKFKSQYISLIDKNNFIETWYNKTSLNCYFLVNDLEKLAKTIVHSFFKKKVAYDHFFDEKFIIAFNNLEDENVLKHIYIPILFVIYNQPQALIYDRIADFLIYNDINKPSSIFDINENFNKAMFIYFLEKVCTKENIQDSPYLNSIEELEGERIKILNQLKLISEDKINTYNAEIMLLTKEASLRKGLLQIHESRIYVDTTNIEKYLGIELPEIFDRYLEFIDIGYSAISSLNLSDIVDEESIFITFYLKEPIPENELPLYLKSKDPRTDPNAVAVPSIRFNYFLDIFNTIKEEFINSEDYGFKSFLSMRIRHGTFSNVLRGVFDKHNLISSKESSTDDYSEIEHWNKNLFIDEKPKLNIQKLLKEFSKNTDLLIERGLSWINVKNELEEKNCGVFDFNFSQDEIYILYHNRMGKIENYDLFLEETFNILYERLDESLKILRERISKELSIDFLSLLEKLQNNIYLTARKEFQTTPIKQSVISCQTDLQLTVNQVLKWFNISKNQYIEEFPIDMIVQNSLDYINSIHTDSIQNSVVKTNFKCDSNFKGKYFEIFGDMLINIFDNIVSKNKDLGHKLKIDISIVQTDNAIEIIIKNNISSSINKKMLKERVEVITQNVKNYKKEGINSSFEEGSGFLKICKCIAVDLERDVYEVEPKIKDNNFEVKINFELNKLIV